MCGIVGYFRGRSQLNKIDFIEQMIAALSHRGSDDSGAWCDRDAGIFMGHARLSILDLSPLGHQPMHSHSNRFVVVFNGEIYNFKSLRAELASEGFNPRSSSDTEVLLGLFDALGVEKTLPKLNGMFSIAVWDKKERALSLARDRFGEKPLYYGWNGEQFFFASELKGITSNPNFQGEIDDRALALMTMYSYIPSPFSAYKGIYKLPPASFITLITSSLTSKPGTFEPHIDAADSFLCPKSYWSLRDIALRGWENQFTGCYNDALQELDTLLSESVKMRMISDVPIGAFLSGGIDSSLVVSLMQKASLSPVKTFSVGFVEDEYNEAHHAMQVARHLGTHHYELYITHREALDVIPLLPSMYDEPFADSSQIPTYLVSKLARQNVTVCLSGDGGDEIFGGYRRYTWANNLNKIIELPSLIKTLGGNCLTCISAKRWTAFFSILRNFFPQGPSTSRFGHRVHRFAEILRCKNLKDLYLLMISHWPDGEILSSREYSKLTKFNIDASWLSPIPLRRRLMFLDQITYLPDDILVKVDRATMAVSLEGRIPLLDHRVAEFAWSLPDEFLFNATGGKRILRDLLSKYIPKNLFTRPKMGFGIPIEHWLKNELREWAEDLLSAKSLADTGFFTIQPIQKRWSDFLADNRPWDQHIWDILMIQSWVRSQKAGNTQDCRVDQFKTS